MPKATILQTGFDSGEVSPLVYGRTDSPRYKRGLATCTNYIPTLQGPLLRRPGTKYLNNVKDSSNPPILVAFKFSATQNYILEFGNQYIRFYANNGQVVTSGTLYTVTGNCPFIGFNFYGTRATTTPLIGEINMAFSSITPGSILEVFTPYQIADVPLLRFSQDADTIFITHPNYPTYKLQRYSAQEWTLKRVFFQDGPYQPLNTLSTYGDLVNVTMSTGAIITPELVQIPLNTKVITNISGMVTDPLGSGQIKVTTSATHGLITGQNIFIVGVVGTTEANNRDDTAGTNPTHPYYWAVQVVDSTHFLLLGSTFTNAYVSGGTIQSGLWGPDVAGSSPNINRTIAVFNGGKRYWGVITNINAAWQVQVSMAPNTLWPASADMTAWQVGVWSTVTGYPSVSCFHQNRLVLGGNTAYPQEIDGSYTGLYEVFAPSDPATLNVSSANAYQFSLASRDMNVIRWLTSTAQGMLAGTYTSEWVVSPSSTSEALSPTNFNAQQTSYFGSSNTEAVQAGNATLYIQRGQRKVREMNYFFNVGTFRSTDLSEVSEHITLPTVTKLAVQKETQPIIWALRSDGNLAAMMYNRDDVSVQAGWAKQYLGGFGDAAGDGASVYSMAVIPSQDLTFDQLWFVVKRYINGSTVYTIEYMTKFFDDSFRQDDSYHFDCGATYDAPKNITAITIASPGVITSAAHGFSNGDHVRISQIVGISKTTTDVNGNTTTTSLLNELNFIVANVTTNTFTLTDFSGSAINTTGWSAYVSGGQVRKLVTTITGLTWLENETVSILADGAIHPDVKVSNSGSITLNFAASKVQIGYKYNSDGKLLRLDAGSANGTAIGQTRRTARFAFMMKNIGDISIGTDFSNLIPANFTVGDQQLGDSPIPLFTGVHRDGLESAYDFESQICWRQNTGLPGMIQSITSFMEEFDV